jgi:hypothetical protein
MVPVSGGGHYGEGAAQRRRRQARAGGAAVVTGAGLYDLGDDETGCGKGNAGNVSLRRGA